MLCAGCIIPDAGIVVEDEFVNVGAVRIVEPTPVTPRADDDCDGLSGFAACPRVPDTLPSGLIRPDSPLCVCQQGDAVGLGGFEIFVEDPDTDEAGDPRDDIIGAFFLDMPHDAEDPGEYLAYTNVLPPEEPARRFRASEVQTIERPDPHLKAWTIPREGRWDLCNDNDAVKLDAGVHQLRLIVTDRPWYRPLMGTNSEGEDVYGEPVIGMPELRSGATYDTTYYVFECFHHESPPEGIECSCEV